MSSTTWPGGERKRGVLDEGLDEIATATVTLDAINQPLEAIGGEPPDQVK
jgi:hypothetical protein